VGGAWSYLRISNALGEREKALGEKDLALAEREKARLEALQLRDIAVGQTYRALLSETQALRLAHVEGWRYSALQKLQNLAQMDTPQRNLVELRSEAIACLGEFDAREVMRLEGHSHSVWSLDFSPDGKLLATAGWDGRVQIWDVNEGKQVREVTVSGLNPKVIYDNEYFIPSVRFRPDGTGLVFARWFGGVEAVSIGKDQENAKNIPFIGPANYLSFDKSGTLLAVGGGKGQVALLDATSRSLKKMILTNYSKSPHFPVALNPGGNLLAAIGPDNTILLFDLINEKKPLSLGRHRNIIRSLAFSRSGNLLASASEDNSIKLWDIGRKQEPLTLVGHGLGVNGVAFSPDGKLVASVSEDQTVRFWDVRTGQMLMTLNPGINRLLSVAFSPDGAHLAVGSAYSSNSCVLYQLTSRQEKQQLVGHSRDVDTIAFHPGKSLLASGSLDKSIILWNLQTAQVQTLWPGFRLNPINKIAFAPKSDLLAVGVGKFINISATDFAIDLRSIESGKIVKRLEGPQSSVNCLVFDSLGNRLAAATSNGITYVWDLLTDRRSELKSTNVREIAFLGKGEQLAIADTKGILTIHHLKEKQLVQKAVLKGGLECLAVAPDEQSLAIGSADGTLSSFTIPRLESSFTLKEAHTGAIRIVAFSPNGQLLASYGVDHKVVLWNARTGDELCVFPQKLNVHSLAFDSDSVRLAICGTENSITLWNFSLVRPGLASIGLDWNGSLPRVAPNALAEFKPSAKAKTVKINLKPTGTVADKEKSNKVKILALLDLYANPFDPDAHLQFGLSLLESGKMEPGHAHLMVGLTLRSQIPSQQLAGVQTALKRCGEFFVSQHRWQEGADAYYHLARFNPGTSLATKQAASVLLKVKDYQRYHELCRLLLARFANTTSAFSADRVAGACLMAGPWEENKATIAKLVQVAVDQGKNSADLPWYQFARGLFEFRENRPDSALDWFKLSLPNAAARNGSLDCLNKIYSAMALKQLGRDDEAFKMYQLVAPRIEQAMNTELRVPGVVSWHDWLFCHLAQEEAKKLFKIED
jgi:WD40 repeat protein